MKCVPLSYLSHDWGLFGRKQAWYNFLKNQGEALLRKCVVKIYYGTAEETWFKKWEKIFDLKWALKEVKISQKCLQGWSTAELRKNLNKQSLGYAKKNVEYLRWIMGDKGVHGNSATCCYLQYPPQTIFFLESPHRGFP